MSYFLLYFTHSILKLFGFLAVNYGVKCMVVYESVGFIQSSYITDVMCVILQVNYKRLTNYKHS